MKAIKIKLVGLNKEFHTRRQTIVAVRDVNMEFPEAGFVALVGPSGCGKSTIIRMIDDLVKPTSGQILIDGEDVTRYRRLPAGLARKIGFVFQQPNLYPWLTVRENVMLPLKIFGLKGADWRRRGDGLLEKAGLAPHADAYPTEISGGAMQRAGVVRALVTDPEILLMDEPFGALDESTRELLNIELLETWERTKKTIVFITHNVEEAVLLSDKIYVMGTGPGRVIDEVTVDLPRPRSLAMLATAHFAEYCGRVSASIGRLDLSKIK